MKALKAILLMTLFVFALLGFFSMAFPDSLAFEPYMGVSLEHRDYGEHDIVYQDYIAAVEVGGLIRKDWFGLGVYGHIDTFAVGTKGDQLQGANGALSPYLVDYGIEGKLLFGRFGGAFPVYGYLTYFHSCAHGVWSNREDAVYLDRYNDEDKRVNISTFGIGFTVGSKY